MSFLLEEEQVEEMVQLARICFGSQHKFKKKVALGETFKELDLATVSALMSLDPAKRFNNCISCENHLNHNRCEAMFLHTLYRSPEGQGRR
ncbi:hypothetical protein NPIL_667051 [Nephila pilipes]|uniref:Uncharacterized protein n=1 Tax=Nephila pilipes TaxID=299642 RepID=A0A8X6PDU5_NEPPI|nr:hypothetical protein NPIL_667051 [Nephila pilipes]